ncbi:TolC family protein [Acidiphilium cryptum]|uniref:Outer membrane efflux protein n=1 Tax=Acidiphilium cryptum (strain JF-5) TaxID=349163 RepID=A5FT05_ACICJ|nr:TolC family protein [Acidiphilium cryptum]ABQ28737.1 outer membrane efflux protein [Acidiphilium cryptum JF-5]
MKKTSRHLRFRPSRVGALALATLLAGCARYQPAPLHPGTSATALLGRRLDEPALGQFLAAMGVHPRGHWGLRALTLVAVYERPDLRISVAAYNAAKAAVTTAQQIPNPTLSLAPSFNATQAFPSPIKIGPVISFLVSNLGAREAGIAAARDRQQAARILIAAAAWRERSNVRNALLTLWLDERIARIKARVASYAATASRLVAQRVTSGMLADTVLASTTEAANKASFGAAEARVQIGMDRAHLAAAIGMPAAALRGKHLSFTAFEHPLPPANLAALTRTALVTSPSVVGAYKNYRAADASLRKAIDQQFPGFRIGSGYHYDQGASKFILALSLPLPILNQNQGPIAEARARRQLAAALFDRAQVRVLHEIDAAKAALQGSVSVARAARLLLATARERERQAIEAYRAGATGQLRMVEAEQQATLVREQELTTDAQRLRALAALADALHHPIFRESHS